MENTVEYVRNPDFIFRKIVEEIILVPIVQDVANMDCVYALNEVGASLWTKLEHPLNKSKLKQAILEEYDTEPDVVEADLEVFLASMLEAGAIREVK